MRPTDPTPKQIAERAAEIRAGWSPAEYARRAPHLAGRRWLPPGCRHGQGVGITVTRDPVSLPVDVG